MLPCVENGITKYSTGRIRRSHEKKIWLLVAFPPHVLEVITSCLDELIDCGPPRDEGDCRADASIESIPDLR